MHNETITNSPTGIRKKNIILIAAGILLISTISAASYVSSTSKITYQEPDNGNSITFNPNEHSFIVHNVSGLIVSGTYTETSESYNCKNDQGFGETIIKEGNDKISYNGHTLTRK